MMGQLIARLFSRHQIKNECRMVLKTIEGHVPQTCVSMHSNTFKHVEAPQFKSKIDPTLRNIKILYSGLTTQACTDAKNLLTCFVSKTTKLLA